MAIKSRRLIFGLVVALVSAATPLVDARAQSKEGTGLELIVKASKAFDDGDYVKAQATIDEAFKGNLDKELSARAMLLRGQIHEKSGKLSRALSDYSGALWMQNLPASEKKKATDGKERVMAAMGLATGAAKPAGASASAQTKAADQQTATQPSGGLFGMFGGLFDNGEQKKPATSPTPAPSTPPVKEAVEPKAKPAPQTKTAAVVTKEKAKPSRQKEEPETETIAVVKPTAAKPGKLEKASAPGTAAAVEAGGFFIDFGSSASSAKARTQAQAIKTKLADILVNRELSVKQGGSAYRIVAGPYKIRAAAAAICNAMTKRGVTCEVTQ